MRNSAVVLSLFLVVSCASKPLRPISRQLIDAAKYSPQASLVDGPVQLINGNWNGPSDTGFSHPYVSIMPDFTVYGDIDRDGNNEAVVVVHESGGGSGIDRVLALFGRVGEEVRHFGSVRLGDRVQVRSVQIKPTQLIAEYVRQGENEPRCCPTEVARTTWNYADGKFSIAADDILGKLGPAFLTGKIWDLQPPSNPPVTLTFNGGTFSGQMGCGHYEVPVKQGEYGGAIVIERTSKKPLNCTSANNEFLDRLQHVSRMGFLPDRLWMSYDLGGDKETGTLEFKEAVKPTSSQP